MPAPAMFTCRLSPRRDGDIWCTQVSEHVKFDSARSFFSVISVASVFNGEFADYFSYRYRVSVF